MEKYIIVYLKDRIGDLELKIASMYAEIIKLKEELKQTSKN